MLREKRRHANSKPNRKLDRKSSRGMIYENEELRLRTININAEVERGQSDIKKLRRENDHLRREIWSLRDEYDRLDKLLRANQDSTCENGTRASGAAPDRPMGFAVGAEYDEDEDDEDDDDEDEENADDAAICERCQQYEDTCECNLAASELRKISAASAAFLPKPPTRDKPNFDDLSVVSEETTRSTDTAISDPDDQRLSMNAPPLGTFEYQSNVPSLSHFENLCYENIGPNLTSSGEVVYNDTTTSPDDEPSSMLDDLPLSLPAVPDAFRDSIGPPDVCMYATANKPLTMRPRHYSNGGPGRFPTGGNLDDLLHDLDNLSVDHSLMHGNDPQRKQRTEMNLVLTLDGGISTITPVSPSAGHLQPVKVDTPQPPIGWKPEIAPKPDNPPKPMFPWLSRTPTAAARPIVPIPQIRQSQSAQQIRRKSITADANQASTGAAGNSPAKPVTATISKRRFSLRRNSDALNAAKATGGPGGNGSSVERTTHSVSSSPESSTSMSLRSHGTQARRISAGSHENVTGSIPWCACWGNGCI